MMRVPLICVAALLGTAVPAAAQWSIQVGVRGGPALQPRLHCPPPPPVCAPVGRFETRWEQVWVPGHWQEQSHPPRYGWVRDHCGRRIWAMIEPGCVHRVWVPGRHEWQARQVWVRC